MRIKPLLIASAALALALPALAQQAALPQPAPATPRANQYPNDRIGPTLTQSSTAPSTTMVNSPADESAVEEVSVLNLAPPSRLVEYPGWARRDPWTVGSLNPADVGLGDNAFGASSGAFLSTLMRRMDAPIASRWAHIALARRIARQAPCAGRRESGRLGRRARLAAA